MHEVKRPWPASTTCPGHSFTIGDDDGFSLLRDFLSIPVIGLTTPSG